MISRICGGEAVGGPAFIQIVEEYPEFLESEIAFIWPRSRGCRVEEFCDQLAVEA
jgi:hypothetical protein